MRSPDVPSESCIQNADSSSGSLFRHSSRPTRSCSMNSFIASSMVSGTSQQLQRRWSQSAQLQQEWRVSQPGRCCYLNTHRPPDPREPGASVRITPKTVTHQAQTQQERFFPSSVSVFLLSLHSETFERLNPSFAPHTAVPETPNIHQKPSSLTETEWWIDKATPLRANVLEMLMRFERSVQTRN